MTLVHEGLMRAAVPAERVLSEERRFLIRTQSAAEEILGLPRIGNQTSCTARAERFDIGSRSSDEHSTSEKPAYWWAWSTILVHGLLALGARRAMK